VELVLLSLIAEEDMYGYQLSQALDARSKGEFALQEGSLYPTLYRMEQRGLISSRHFPVENSKRFRVYYHLEPDGVDYLKKIKKEYAIINRGIMSILGTEDFDDIDIE